MTISTTTLSQLAEIAASMTAQSAAFTALVESLTPAVDVPAEPEVELTTSVILERRHNGKLTVKSAKAATQALDIWGSTVTVDGDDLADDVAVMLNDVGIDVTTVDVARAVGRTGVEVAEAIKAVEVAKAKPEAPLNMFGEPVREATPAEKKAGNAQRAKALNADGIVARGQALKAAKNGERNIKKLKALNAADGLVFGATKALVVAVDAHTPAKLDHQAKVATLVDGGWTRAQAEIIAAAL